MLLNTERCNIIIQLCSIIIQLCCSTQSVVILLYSYVVLLYSCVAQQFDDNGLDYNDQNSNDLFFDPTDFLIKPFRPAV
jgi:hypothetical protein